VTFVNRDSRSHDIESSPHPSFGVCPEIDRVGVVQPGNNRQTGNLTSAAICGFRDRRDLSNESFQGIIVVQ
jgi:hypothetical protein